MPEGMLRPFLLAMPLSKVEAFPRRNASGHLAHSTVVEGRITPPEGMYLMLFAEGGITSPKECIGATK